MWEEKMISNIKKINFPIKCLCIFSMALIMTMALLIESSFAVSDGKMFDSPEQAVEAAVSAIRINNEKDFMEIFGSEGKELFTSGDDVSDQNGREKFVEFYDEKNALVTEGTNMVLEIGKEAWPFPIPLVKNGEQWFFNTELGKEEILNRRIGRNELDTIQTCLAYVDAQREYSMDDADNDGKNQYAQKFVSDPDKKNGLYWEVKEGEDRSPLGSFASQASSEGYVRDKKAKRTPYHGYYFKILKEQGKNAAGGAYDYVISEQMIGGFAMVAYPAEYGNSGIMTFVVNHDGIVYQKDLGDDTTEMSNKMKKFDPDKSWTKAGDINTAE